MEAQFQEQTHVTKKVARVPGRLLEALDTEAGFDLYKLGVGIG